jgi:hypothetical protein
MSFWSKSTGLNNIRANHRIQQLNKYQLVWNQLLALNTITKILQQATLSVNLPCRADREPHCSMSGCRDIRNRFPSPLSDQRTNLLLLPRWSGHQVQKQTNNQNCCQM